MKQTAYLGPEEDFPRRIRETDERYKAAQRRYKDTSSTAKRIGEEIKELRTDALDPVIAEINSLQGWQAIMELVNGHFYIQSCLEEARVKSLEEPGETWVVCAVPRPKKDMKGLWLHIRTEREAAKIKLCADNYIELGRFRDGEPLEIE